jgi:hypothetical protein
MAMGDLSFKSDPLIIGWALYAFAVNCDSMTANGSDARFKYPVDVEEGESIP